jgi:Sec-independent protein translocase protein TatA
MNSILALTISLICSNISGPALNAGAIFNNRINKAESTSIANSDVYWDLYYAFKDKYLENNPSYKDFNPYMICPNYGKTILDENLSKNDLLLIRPSGNDLYLYTWMNTSDNPDFALTSIYPTVSSNTAFDEEKGYYAQDAFKFKEAEIVNTYNFIGNKDNWLGKWVIHDYIAASPDIDFYRAYIQEIYIDPILQHEVRYYNAQDLLDMGMDEHRFEEWAEENNYIVTFSGGIWTLTSRDMSLLTATSYYRKFDCGDEITYQYKNTTKEFEYSYTMPDYVEIKTKKAKLMLNAYAMRHCNPQSPFDQNNFKYNPVTYLTGTGSGLENYSHQFSKIYDEAFYCFFDYGDIYIDGVKQDSEKIIEAVERIDFSYNKTTYNHLSTLNRMNGVSFSEINDPASTACYYNTLDISKLSGTGEDFFTIKDIKQSGQKSIDFDYKVEKDVTGYSNLFFSIKKKFSYDGIVKCVGETSSDPDIEPDGNNAGFIQFIKNQRDYDKDGDGINDSVYKFAFLINNDTRDAVWADGYRWNVANFDVQFLSSCHEISDLTILRLKFSFDGKNFFDLAAMDFTTPLDPNTYVTDYGTYYVTYSEIFTNFLSWLDFNKFSLLGFSSILLLVVVGILFIYFLPYIMPILKGIGKGGKSLKDAIKSANKQYKIDRANKKSVKAPKKQKKNFRPEE